MLLLRVKLVFYRTLYSQSAASLTMGYVAAFLRQANYAVEQCLLERGALDSAKNIVRGSPDIIIAKPNFKDYAELLPLLRAAKAHGAVKRVFLCGPFASMNAQGILAEQEWLDGILYGYPEETACELLASMDAALAWDANCVGGLWRMPSGEIVDTGKRMMATLPDDMPFPARDIEEKEKVGYVNIEASRGCMFNCSFCHVPIYHAQQRGTRRPVRSAKHLVDEVQQIKERYGKTLFIFNDPMFWSGPFDDERIRQICEELLERKLDIHFYVYLRCNPFPSPELLDLLVRAGLVRVFLGVENNAQDSLVTFNKMITPSMADRTWTTLHEHGVNVHLGFITFEPTAPLKDIRRNIEYLHSIQKLCRLGVLIEAPRLVPGSRLLEDLKATGMVWGTTYRDLIYGYSWKHADTEALFNAVRTFFETSKGYFLEYHCVSGRLLTTIAQRACPQHTEEVKALAARFDEMYARTDELVYAALIDAYDAAASGADPEMILEAFRKHDRVLADHGAELAVIWGMLVDDITKVCGSRPIREVFTGKEGIE